MSDNENGKLLDHEYDGIQELDNNLPLWWLWTFFGAIIFAFIYWIHYSLVKDGPSLDQELAQGMAVIEMQRQSASQAPSDGEEVSEEDLVAQGSKIFKSNCASCHLENGGGSIGPNLTDAYWIHGADAASIKTVILDGVLDKGMPPWKAILRPSEIKTVVAFVLSLKNSNVPDGKAAQGDKVSE